MSELRVDLHAFLSILKNVKGCIFFNYDLEGKFIDEIGWLSKRFRYRNLGYAQSLMQAAKNGERDLISRKPFVELPYPVDEIMEFRNLLTELFNGMEIEIDTLILASVYVTPVIVIGIESLEKLNKFIVYRKSSTAMLDERELKRNIRLVNYAIIDFHHIMGLDALSSLKKYAEEKDANFLGKVVENRRRMIEEDCEKRFWRLNVEGITEERDVIVYLDIYTLLCMKLMKEKGDSILEFIEKSSQSLAAALSCIPAFVFDI